MVYSFKIGQVITLGGGIFQYANYKINVDNGRGSSWCVYRRYSDFVDLHKLICIEANDSVIALSIELPAKEVGLLYSASKSVSDKRKVDLEKYLKSLVEIDAKSLPKCLNKFIDNENNGVSGPQIQLGANKILKEAFLKTKYMKYNPVWSTKFCVLTKSGNLHVMKSMYDPTTKAVSNFTLSGDSLVITGRYDMVNYCDYVAAINPPILLIISVCLFPWLKCEVLRCICNSNF